MELLKRIIEFIDINLIYGLIPIILTLFLVHLIFKNKYQTKKALNFIRWIIISYTIISTLYFLIGVLAFPDEFAFINRATGPYYWAYWSMLFASTILPFTLLSNRLSRSFIYVLFVAFGLKIGVYFERFIIIVVSFHRDYSPNGNNALWTELISLGWTSIFLKGIIIAILTLITLEIIKRNNLKDKKTPSI